MTEKTQQQIADALGVDQKTVSRDLGKNSVRTEKMPKQPRTKQGFTQKFCPDRKMSKQLQIADECRVLCKNSVRTEKMHKQPRTYSRYTINQGFILRSYRAIARFPCLSF